MKSITQDIKYYQAIALYGFSYYLTLPENVPEQVSDYIRFFNEGRPAYTLGYLTPKQYRERFVSKRESAAQAIAGNV